MHKFINNTFPFGPRLVGPVGWADSVVLALLCGGRVGRVEGMDFWALLSLLCRSVS